MGSPRADRDALLFAVDREIDELQRPVARAVVAAVRRYAEQGPDGPRMTTTGRMRVLAEVDAALAPIYGQRRGDPSARLYRLLLARASDGAALPAAAADAELRARLRRDPDVLAALEQRDA